jgi:uncharacterized membrane protein YhaH (DUF805 family)
MSWYIEVLKKYAVFSGRARRKEYWFFLLFYTIISYALSFIDYLIGSYSTYNIGIISIIYSIAFFIPTIAVTIRRLHDTDRSGWWLIGSLLLIPLIMIPLYLVFGHLSINPFSPDQVTINQPLTEPNTAILIWIGITALVVFVYYTVILVFMCLPSTVGMNKYGTCPIPDNVDNINTPKDIA